MLIRKQIKEAPVTVALFTDTDLVQRARKIARTAGIKICLKKIAILRKIFRLSTGHCTEQQRVII